MSLLTPELGYFFWSTLIFLCLLIILKRYAWKPILAALHSREEEISNALSSAQKLKEEMQQIKADNEQLLKLAQEEKKSILAEAKKAQSDMLAEARQKAKEESKRLLEEAQANISTQQDKAIQEAKQQIATWVIDISQKILQRELANKKEQDQYVQQLMQQIELNNN